jgi:glutathionylspermidine synthase
MQRHKITPRNNWQKAVENLGFGFHSTDVPYWDESAYYSFTLTEIDAIEKATTELYEMSLAAVQHVIDHKKYDVFKIPNWIIPYLEASWNNDEPAIYGRMDLCYKNGQLKLLEFNADTPTSLFEAAIVQWFWLQDLDKTKDQFNSLHEKLIAYWKYLKPYMNNSKLHFTCVKDSLEDLTNTEYLRDCAIQAGYDTKLVFIDDIGADDDTRTFVDLEDESIANLFKLYPWEWLLEEEFGKMITDDAKNCKWIEPAWKMILSNKAILPILWDLYPEHPLLLKAAFSADGFINYVKKPLLSREGANIQLVENGQLLASKDGDYGKEGYIFQELFTLPNYDDNYPVIGSWIVGQEPAGMGIRESNTLITDNLSRFIPHWIE